ncbi:ornithine cyclodeaminase family protein [Staphylococcus intermedius]|uniref:Ornithine cyclodeaminase/mu-crystallin family protein n=1 Tax=Staphylococcus intermedius NCTC 11048 TaxID=1141106 RepID=A0A380G7Q3_STAIN|nr:ornithine cyclodeaminase [Staphylococcus intermedius]PCF64656.1 ornithine cyclodeaminase [Staphylococcus intermedius]PCF80266.1 ornithine cyclodeaminase [Staphylococcus intermedius]PCF81616.1 ornithine cyclodeaminase [Staphylococcus intermedius]PNZ51491.1 ornithine cyclodeaminase [Staphylococcus intermedius NCTC 11048]SUM46466.1 ornithine cyclodeaminase/mu-crystallin family protein [Staphylococcus intermedius NCTC 11048]
MKVFNEEKVKNTYQMSDAINDIEQLFTDMDGISLAQRTVIPTGEGAKSMLYMPCVHTGRQLGIVKITSITPDNPQNGRPTTQGNIIVTDLETGEHVVSMDGSYLTRLRTGALSGIATKYLSRENATTLGMIGTGGMAYEQLLANIEVRDIERVILFNRTVDKAEDFKARVLAAFPNLSVEVVDDVKKLVEQADIINCQTQSSEPVFDADTVQPGTHINGIGSYRPDMKEIDNRILPKADKVYFDDFEGVKEEAGEIIEANEKGIFKFEDVDGDLKALSLNGQLQRTDDDSITVFKCVGAAYFDLAVALGAYERLIQQ